MKRERLTGQLTSIGTAKLEPFFSWTITAIFPPSSHNTEHTVAPVDSAGAILPPAWKTKCHQEAGKRKRSVSVLCAFSQKNPRLLNGREAPSCLGSRTAAGSGLLLQVLGCSSCSGSSWPVQHGLRSAYKGSSQKGLNAINNCK